MLLTKVVQLCFVAAPVFGAMTKTGSVCTVTPSGSSDDSDSILAAFKQCGQNGRIDITTGDFTIGKVIDVLNLKNCEINIRGNLTWTADIQYWVKNSVSVVFQQRSTAFRLGGENFSVLGHGQALFNGNGQAWYDANRNGANMAGRPISLTLWHAKNAVVDGITWRQVQFW
jgi:galacturan 1,4-alpha-galacturonidase